MVCKNCGFKLNENYKFCPNCGKNNDVKLSLKESFTNVKITGKIAYIFAFLIAFIYACIFLDLFFVRIFEKQILDFGIILVCFIYVIGLILMIVSNPDKSLKNLYVIISILMVSLMVVICLDKLLTNAIDGAFGFIDMCHHFE